MSIASFSARNSWRSRVPDGISCRLILTTQELEAFAPQWIKLWSQDPHATPFQRPEWLVPWWHHFGQPELRAVAILQDDELVGFLPFYIYCEPRSGERQLLPLGAGTTDYLDGIYSAACSHEHVKAALDRLHAEGDWDVLTASQLPRHSLLFQVLQQLDRSHVQPFDGQSCSRMRAVRMAELPRNIRRNSMYYRNRAMRLGKLELTATGASNWSESFDELERLHTSRWNQSGQPGVLADPRVLAWHREALPKLERNGMLRLCSLRLDDEIISVLYSLIDPPSRVRKTQFFYLTAYSTDHAELRPGTLLVALAIDAAAAEGVETIDMLRGDEGYKSQWHMEPVSTYGFAVRYLPENRKRASMG
jgi:CelD/BcsL family acetyltransferase involved in cellulose biosynthesis